MFRLVAAVCALVLLASAALAVDHHDNLVELTKCDDSLCHEPCTKSYFAQDQCLTESGFNDTLELHCHEGPAVCVTSTWFKDEACRFPISVATDVCGTCKDQYRISCGGMKDGIMFVYNCSDKACADCGASKLLKYGECTKLSSGGIVMVHRAYDCKAVRLNSFPNSANCDGTPIAALYPDGYCDAGVKLHCTKRPSQQSFAGDVANMAAQLLGRLRMP